MTTKSKYNKFIFDSNKIAFDIKHRKILKFNMSKYNNAVEKGRKFYKNIQIGKDRTSYIRNKAINKLDECLLLFEKNFTRNGGKILWADDGYQAVKHVKDIIKDNKVKQVLKSKSMISEEIELNERLKESGIEVIETDLGEFIVQVADEKPYHIVTPAMHKSKEDIKELFKKKFNISEDSTPEDITKFVREKLRKKFENNTVSITGGNFLVSDVGAVSITENEGNALLANSLSKIHIAIVGIEKTISSINDLSTLLPILAVHGTGQNITVYNSLFFGPKRKKETDGVEKMYVILLDNGRTNIYNDVELKESLACIRCGACLNACPVYENAGGHTYDTVYTGPIGSIITPHLKSIEDYNHLSYACSLCGKCTEKCPVQINLQKLLLANRRKTVENELYSKNWRKGIKLFKSLLTKQYLINIIPITLRNFLFQLFLKKYWGNKRNLPKIKKSFKTRYKKHRSIKV